MIVLATGAAGQVGRELVSQARRRGIECLAFAKDEFDITDPASIQAGLSRGPSTGKILINLAGYTGVDAAEADCDTAFRVNAEGVEALARACASTGTAMLHLSTDYVFDGMQDRAYEETEPVNPINVYGRSKVAGEEALRSILHQHLIVRTSWVFGARGSNFVTTMLRLAKREPEVAVVADEVGSPTAAVSLAATLLTLAERLAAPIFGEWGTYHYCGRPATSRAQFARAIFDLARGTGKLPTAYVRDIGSSDYPAQAKRPPRSVLDCGKVERTFGITQPEWRPCLEAVLRELARSGT